MIRESFRCIMPCALAAVLTGLATSASAAIRCGWYVDDFELMVCGDIHIAYVDGSAQGANNGSSWSDAFVDLQSAISFAAANASITEIWVADGTYMPDGGRTPVGAAHVNGTGSRNASFSLLSNVAIYGGFAGGESSVSQRDIAANPAILSGDLFGNDSPVGCVLDSDCFGFGDNCLDGTCNIAASNGDNSFHVVTGTGAPLAIFDGFTVTAGNANGGTGSNNRGGGMFTGGGSPIVANCLFTRNFAIFGGGGMYDSSNGMKVTACTFLGNTCGNGGGGGGSGGGGMVLHSANNATITKCTFRDNVSKGPGGGGGGEGGGLNISGDSTYSVLNCAFFGNQAATGGGMAVSSAGGPIVNLAFSGNSATNGGALSLSGGSTLTNCTFSRNTASSEGGGIYATGSPTIRNSILWQNSDAGGMDESAQIHGAGGSPVVNYSIVHGGWTGASGPGNLGGNPQFVDANGADNIYGTPDDDLRVMSGSPAIDSANNGHLQSDFADLDDDGDTGEAIPIDLAGNSRQVDDPIAMDTGVGPAPVVDMGAHERQVGVGIVYVDAGAAGANNGTTWADAFLHPQDALSLAASDPSVPEIWVADGTYMPDGGRTPIGEAHVIGVGDRTATFQLPNNLTIYGGFAGGEGVLAQRDIAANPTILSGDLFGDDTPVACTQNSPDCDSFGGLCVDGFCTIADNNDENSHHVVTGSGTNATGILDGFTISAGNANGSAPEDRGAAMFIDAGSPTVANCTLSGNSAAGPGGATYHFSSSPSILDCTFHGNSAGTNAGAMFNLGSNPTVANCIFDRNKAQGSAGAMENDFNSSPTVIDCEFTGNSANANGGGMFNVLGSSPTLTNCAFSGNSAGIGGAVYNLDGSPTLTKCVFSVNAAAIGGGVYNGNSSPAVTNCAFSGNAATQDGGGMFNNGSSPMLVNCAFSGNSADVTGGGMSNHSSSNPTLINCTFSGNSADLDGGGMDNLFSSSPSVINSIFWGNSDSGGMDESAQIHAASGSVPTVYRSVVQGGWTGGGGTGNSANDPLFVDANGADNVAGTPDDDLQLSPGSPASDSGDNSEVPPDTADIDGDGDVIEETPFDLAGNMRRVDDPFAPETGVGPVPIVDMGAHEVVTSDAVVYVDASATGAGNGGSWPHAFVHLQTALAFALANPLIIEIWVADGTYMPDGGRTPLGSAHVAGSSNRDATFQLINGVEIYGGFAGGETMLSQRDPAVNATILSGDLLDDDSPVPCTQDSDCVGLADLCLDDFCIRDGNMAENSYHVVTGSGTDATARLDGLTIASGRANGPSFPQAGGGMANVSGSPTVISCSFENNSPAAMLNTLGTTTVTNCTFRRNEGAISNSALAHARVRNCLFHGNGAGFGAAINNSQSNTMVTNCTLVGNRARFSGGGVYNLNSSSPSIANSILWDNSDAGGMDESAQIHTDSGTPVVNYSIVQGGWSGAGGTGNGSDDPLLVDADGDDDILGTSDDNLRLSADSPAVDAGSMLFVPGGLLDLDGHARVMDGDADGTAIVDMGAYEFSADCNLNGVPDGLDIVSGALTDADSNGVPDQCSPFTGFCVPPLNTRWSCPDNWEIPGGLYPDDVESAPGIFVTLGPGATVDLDVDATVPGLSILNDATLEVIQSGSGDLTVNTESGILIEGSLLAGNDRSISSLGVVTIAPGGLYEPGTSPSSASLSAPSLRIEGPPSTLDGLPAATMILRDSMSVYLTGGGEHRSYGDILVGEDSLIEVASGEFFIDGDGIYAAAAAGARSVLRVGTDPCCGKTCYCKLSANGPPHTPTFELSGEMAIEVNGDFVNQGVVRMADAATIDLTGMYQMKAGSIHEKNANSLDPTTASLVAADILIEPGQQAPDMLLGPRLELTDSMTVHSTGPLYLQGGTLKPGVDFPPTLNLSGGASLIVDGTFTMTGVAESNNSSVVGVFVAGDFANRLFSSNLFDWTAGRLTLDGGTPQAFEVAATDTGPTDSASDMPFAVGALRIAAGAEVTFVDTFNNDLSDQSPCSEAVYVGTLTLEAGALVTLDNCRVYYETLERDPSAAVSFSGCGELRSISNPAAPLQEPSPVAKNRFISFVLPPTGGEDVLVRVELTSLHHPAGPPNAPSFTAFEGQYRYLNAIRDGSNNPVYSCPDSVAGGTSFGCAKLGCSPEYRDWAGIFGGQGVHVIGDSVVPSSQYAVAQLAASCAGDEASCTALSAELMVSTERWGNVDNTPTGAAPNAIDISRVVDKVKDLPGAFIEPRCQLREATPNPYGGAVNAQDIGRVVDAVKGQPYPFTISVCP